MKILLLFIFMCMTVSALAQHKYMDKEITDAQLDKLYSAFGKYIYAFENNTYDLSTDDPKVLKTFKNSDSDFGVITVKINNANMEKKELSAERCDGVASTKMGNSNKRCMIINASAEKSKGKVEIPVLKLDKEKYNYTSLSNGTVLLTQLSPADKNQFKTFLEKGGECYSYKRISPEFIACNMCHGNGKTYNTGVPVPCKNCNGACKIKPKNVQYSKDKIIPESNN